MREFEKKTRYRNIVNSRWALIPLLVLFVLLANSTWNVYQKNKLILSDLKIAESKLTKANERRDELASAAKSLETDRGIEGEIRDRLQMVKEGEKELVIVEEAENPDQFVSTEKTILQKIIDFFTIR